VHYVDAGVDTGPIVRAEGFRDPFGFESIWDCKGHSFMLAFDLLIGVARDMDVHQDRVPVGTVASPSPHGAPEFKRADFTVDRRRAAERGYHTMRTGHA
jgi:phosphoribosylglycinamide formyltransferase-1